MFTVTSPESFSATKAVVIMYGWLGAQPKHLQKYADMYSNITTDGDGGEDYLCSVVHGTASARGIMIRDKSELTAAVIESVQKAARIVKELEKRPKGDEHDDEHEEINNDNDNSTVTTRTVPVVIHYLSNGGAYVAEQLEQMIQEAKHGRLKTANRNLEADVIEDLKLIANRLQTHGCEIADSAPVYMHVESAMRAIDTAIPSAPSRWLIKCLFYANTYLRLLGAWISRTETEPEIFWNNMIRSELCPRQAFIYSSADTVTDVSKLDELIGLRKKRVDVEVSVLKFDDSEHVLHYRKYPKEYIEFVKKQLLGSSRSRPCT